VSRGTSAQEESAPEVWEALSADGASPYVVSVEVDWASSQPGNNTEGFLLDWVMCGINNGAPGSTALGNTTSAPGSSGAADPGVSGLLPPGSPNFPSLPINWRQVEDNAAFTCLYLTDAERMLHETLASVGWNILRPIWVSLKKERKVCLCASGFLRVPLFPPIFVSAAPVPG
jgi:hypothetical protein